MGVVVLAIGGIALGGNFSHRGNGPRGGRCPGGSLVVVLWGNCPIG